MVSNRSLRAASVAGFLATGVLAAFGAIGFVDGLVVLGAATVVPLGVSLARDHRRDGEGSSSERMSFALVVLASLAVPLSALAPSSGAVRVFAGVLHLVSSCVIGLRALGRIAWRGVAPIDELAIDLGCVMLPVGAAFGLAARTGIQLLGFGEPVVTFTAAHFHYAGFAAPIVLGGVGRLGWGEGDRASFGYRVGTIAVLAGVPLTAAGIAFGPSLERVAAVILASGIVVAVFVAVPLVLRAKGAPLFPRLVLAMSFAGLLVPMALAATFALTGSAGRGGVHSTAVSLATMIRFHGAMNALVFAVPALSALAWLDPRSRHAPSGFPFSRLRGGLRIGPDFFERRGALGGARRPTGIVDTLDAYASPTFDPSGVDSAVRGFYEHTADYDLEITPRWSFGFRSGGRAWRAIARRIGQVELPTDAPSGEHVVSRIVDLNDEVDGRAGARGWIRTYADTGRALYVAAYAATGSRGTTLMNIAFPLPGCALVSVLRFDRIATPGGLRVTTVGRANDLVPDEGIFLATRWLTLRLPMTEWVEVRPTDEPAVVMATHELFLFGLRYLVLEYRMVRRR